MSRQVSRRRIPEEVALMLGRPPATEGTVIGLCWAANGIRAATTTTYLPDQMATETEPGLVPAAAHIEVQAPSPGIASQLELPSGH